MARDLHFSLDSLQDRYRQQVIAQLSAAPSRFPRPSFPLPSRTPSPLPSDKGGSGEASGCRDEQKASIPKKPKALLPPKTRKHRKQGGSSCAAIRTKADPESRMTKTEGRFNALFLLGRGSYEPITLRMAGGNYTPDWKIVDTRSNGVILVETKGSYRLPTQGRSVFAFKQAVSDFPEFIFIFAEELDNKGTAWDFSAFANGRLVEHYRGTPARILSESSVLSFLRIKSESIPTDSPTPHAP